MNEEFAAVLFLLGIAVGVGLSELRYNEQAADEVNCQGTERIEATQRGVVPEPGGTLTDPT